MRFLFSRNPSWFAVRCDISRIESLTLKSAIDSCFVGLCFFLFRFFQGLDLLRNPLTNKGTATPVKAVHCEFLTCCVCSMLKIDPKYLLFEDCRTGRARIARIVATCRKGVCVCLRGLCVNVYVHVCVFVE